MSSQVISAEEAVRILKESGCSPRVIRHCRAVAKLAGRIADECARNGVHVDAQLINAGALLHDIGRSRTHSVHHAATGGEIARSLNLPTEIVSIIERHVGGGITAEEAVELGWPRKNYVPETVEEKIVSYADKLIEDDRVAPIEKTMQRLRFELGADHPAIRRLMELHREMSNLCKGFSH